MSFIAVSMMFTMAMAALNETEIDAQSAAREDLSMVYCFVCGIILAHFLNVVTGRIGGKTQADGADCSVQSILFMLG